MSCIFLPPRLQFPFITFPSFLPSIARSLTPSRSLPAKSANSHADLSLDRWSRAESVYLHTAPNKTSRCLQSRRSPPITMIPKQEEETAQKPSGRQEQIVNNRGQSFPFPKNTHTLLQTHSLQQTRLNLVSAAFSPASVCHLDFLSPLPLFFLELDVFMPQGVSGSHRHNSFSFLFLVSQFLCF